MKPDASGRFGHHDELGCHCVRWGRSLIWVCVIRLVGECLDVSSYWIVAGGLVAIVVAGLAIWLVPRRQVARWRRDGYASGEKLVEFGLQARTGITQALGGLALIVTLAITGYQANQAQRSADVTQEPRPPIFVSRRGI